MIQHIVNVFQDYFLIRCRKNQLIFGKSTFSYQRVGADSAETNPGISPGIGFISTVCDWFIWINYKHLSGSKAPGLTSGRIESGTVQHKMDDELISWHGTDMSGRAVLFASMDQTDIKEAIFQVFKTAESSAVRIFYIWHLCNSFFYFL